ncbi:hypothetical protein [Pseudomonas savastanoi]|uniref:hypothetical protein n=1 Tax=Pseudomonas savastanoi TaxID=29438 RepID=UPI000F00AE62|nr:hypothetical protein [Pseudomonas savastanoi]
MHQRDHEPHEKPIEIVDEHGKKTKNPNRITVNQHVVSQKHQEQWAGTNKLLSVVNKLTGERLVRAPKDAFVVTRLWDQPGEAMVKSTEDWYQTQLGILKTEGAISRHSLITEYFVMMAARAWCAEKERPLYDSIMEPPINVPSQAELETDELEQVNESVRVVRGFGDSHAMARFVVSQGLNMFFMRGRERHKATVWVPLKNSDASFVLPDSVLGLLNGNILAFPVSPSLALVDERLLDFFAGYEKLWPDLFNTLFKQLSRRYYVEPPTLNA